MGGRPLKGKERSISYGFSMPGEYQSMIIAAKELAARENKSFSDIMQADLADYLKVHYPGNPQPPLIAQSEATSQELDFSLGYMRYLLSMDLKTWDKLQPEARTPLAKKITAELLKATRIQDRIHDTALGDLITKARLALGI